jgi:hypothetical protein
MAWFVLFEPEIYFCFCKLCCGGLLYRTLKGAGEENVFDEGTRGNIWRERSVVMGN